VTEQNDQELLKNVKNGDKNAFKEIIGRYEHQVAATVISMLGKCGEAEDIGQETFMRFYQSLDKFRGESSVGTYLTRIAINLSINELRRRIRRRKFFFSKSDGIIENVADTNNSTKNKEIKEIVQQGIQKLEPKFRAVVVLRLIDQYSTQETADILNLPVGTVLSRLARAQMKLKEILTPLYGEKHE
jgi:RNA polymerase sigma-70 factor (ECF subfamily)